MKQILDKLQHIFYMVIVNVTFTILYVFCKVKIWIKK